MVAELSPILTSIGVVPFVFAFLRSVRLHLTDSLNLSRIVRLFEAESRAALDIIEMIHRLFEEKISKKEIGRSRNGVFLKK
jgi:hypothetical protein